MSTIPACCSPDKKTPNTFVYSKLFGAPKTMADVQRSPSSNATKRPFPVNKFVAIFVAVLILAFILGCVALCCAALSAFGELQKRIITLEHRLESLEGSHRVHGGKSSHQIHTPSSMEALSSFGRRRRNVGRERRTTRRPTRGLAMAAIHMEMVNVTQRRKRSSSTENSNLISNWKVSDWVPQGNRESFRIPESHTSEIVVKHKGLYYVYSQILFYNLADRNIFVVKIDGKEFTRCYKSVDYAAGDANIKRYKSCYTGAVALINANESVTIHNVYNHEIDASPNSNFFGLIKLADVS